MQVDGTTNEAATGKLQARYNVPIQRRCSLPPKTSFLACIIHRACDDTYIWFKAPVLLSAAAATAYRPGCVVCSACLQLAVS